MDLSIFQNQGKYLMLAFDHRGSFKKYVNPADPAKATEEDLVKVKGMVISALEDQFSGVLLDVDWGLAGYKSKSKPYLLPLEKSGYTDVEGDRTTELEYTAKELKDLGASGTKLLLYFNPEAKNCDEQLATAKQALEDSHQNDLPLFLEIVTYGNEELGKTRAEWILRSVQMLLEHKIVPEVWKLEYPSSAEATAGKAADLESCKQIIELVGNTPWILLTRGEKFDAFANQLKDAVSAGAVGFLAGRALWQEIGECKTDEERQEFLDKTVRNRFKIISEIALNS